ncbi:MAG: alpha-L-fucosidase, partial [Planctomycetota bacterium]
GQALYDLCMRLQPGVLVNNRVDKGRGGMAGMQTGPGFAGDFGTPEQEIPATGLPGVAWETCMTMNCNWGYNSHDHDFKSARELVLKLVDVASKGGNFLLNVGPTAEGRFPPESISRLKEIGAWMRIHGEAIHGATAGPFPELPWGRCTERRLGRRSVLYLHVFDWPEDGALVVPGIGNRARRAALMGREEDSLAVLRRGEDLVVHLPRTAPVSLCPVVALEITGPPVIFRPPVVEAAADIFVDRIQVRLKSPSRELQVRYTLDGREPGFRSPRYGLPLHFSHTTTLEARSFFRGRPVGPLVERTFTRVRPRPASAPLRGEEGFTCRVFAGEWDRLPDFDSMQPTAVEEWGRVRLPPGPPIEFAGRRFTGSLEIPAADVYLFALTADDGARLWVDGELVVDNDGLHGPRRVQGRIALSRGSHPIRVDYFNKTGGAVLRLEMAPAGGEWKEVPARAPWRM